MQQTNVTYNAALGWFKDIPRISKASFYIDSKAIITRLHLSYRDGMIRNFKYTLMTRKMEPFAVHQNKYTRASIGYEPQLIIINIKYKI